MRTLTLLAIFVACTAAAAPQAEFTWVPENPSVNDVVEFRDQSTGATSTVFYVENSHPQAGPIAYFAFNVKGVYEMKLVATSSSGSSTRIKWINVGVDREARMSASRTTAKVGETIVFTDRSTGLVKSRTWTFGDGAQSTAEVAQHAWDTPGTYAVKLQARYSSGSKTATTTVVITDDEPPVPGELIADFDWKPEIPFAGQSIEFTDESTGEPQSWSWDFDDDNTSAARNPKHTYDSPGEYRVVLAARKGSDVALVTKTVHVASPTFREVLLPSFLVEPACLLTGDPVYFIDRTEGSPIGWNWNFGEGTSSAERSPVMVYEREGKYVVTLEVFDGTQRKQTSREINVVANPRLVPNASFASPCCAASGIPRDLVNTSTNASSFVWDFGDGTKSTVRSPSHTWSSRGTYMITLTAKNENGEHTFARSIRVDDDQAPRADFFWQPSTDIGVNQAITFVNRSDESAVAFKWTIAGPGPAREAMTRDLAHSFPQTGQYRVTLEVTSMYGTKGSVTKEVTVHDDKLIAGFQCSVTGGFRNVIPAPCGAPACLEGGYVIDDPILGTSHWECIRQEPTNCVHTVELPNGEKTSIPGVIYGAPIPIDYKTFTCTDQSTGSPDLFQWSPPDPNDRGRTYSGAYQSAYDGRPTPVEIPISLTVHRLEDGASSTATYVLRDDGGGSATGETTADFTWSPLFPKEGETVTFQAKAPGATTFEWAVDSQARSPGPRLIEVFKTAGTHQVILETRTGGRIHQRAKSVEVAPKDTPKIENVTSPLGQCYFSTVALPVQIKADVKWGTQPGLAWYSINDGGERSITPGDKLAFSFSSDDLKFSGTSGDYRDNFLTIRVKNTDQEEARFRLPLSTFNTSGWIANDVKTESESEKYTVISTTRFPQPAWEGEITFKDGIPFVGGQTVGLAATQAILEEKYATDCNATTTVKGKTGFKFGKYGEISGALFGRETTKLSPGGIATEKGSLGFELEGVIEPEVELLKLLPATSGFCGLLDPLCKFLKLKSEFKLNTAAEFEWARPRASERKFLGGKAIIEAGLKVGTALSPRKGVALEIWGGGAAKYEMRPESPIIRKIEVGLETSLIIKVWALYSESKAAVVCEWEHPVGWKPCKLDELAALHSVDIQSGTATLLPIPVHGRREVLSQRSRTRGESVVLESLSSLAAPQAAASGNEIMAVYLSEDASAANVLHRTDVHYVTREADDWSEPKPIAADSFGDFAASITASPNGGFVALWQRIRNTSLRVEDIATSDDLPKLNREMEIVASTWTMASRSWSSPVALTDNAVYDHDPRAVALADGRIIAVWLRDRGNRLTGTTADPTEIVSRTFSNGAWGPETSIASGLLGVQRLATASRENAVTVAFAHDKNGSGSENDLEIGVVTLTGGAWSAPRNLTSDSTPDTAPAVVYGNDGARIVWLSGDDLVWQPLSDGSREVIRASQGSAAFTDIAAAFSPDGRYVVVFTEVVDGPADVITRTYDPAAKLWSNDIPLTRNDAVESSLSTFFARGKLQVAGLETETLYTDVIRVVDGEEIVIPNVAEPGESRLVYLEKELIVDLSVDQYSIAASAASPANGDQVKLTAIARNDGDLPLRNVPVVLFAGRGTSGNVLATATVTGDWAGGQSRTIEIDFPYSATTTEVTLAVDPLGASGDRSLANNSAIYSYSNIPPAACLQLSRMIGVAPLTITADSRCSSDRDGALVATRWSFGDGGAAQGEVATHTFTDEGIHNVTVTVTDNLGRTSSASAAVYVNAMAELRRNRQTSSRYLAVAGRTAGVAGTFFVSDVMILNPDPAVDLVVDALYMPAGRLDYYYERLIVPPARMLNLVDIVAKTFHASGVGWVRFDLSNPNAVITSRSYNSQPRGTAGTLVPSTTIDDAVTRGRKRVFLQDVRQGFRVNLGLTEISGDGAEVRVSAYSSGGALVGQKSYQLAPYSFSQIGGEALFQQPGRIEVEASSGTVLAYISTIDNATGDAVYQPGIDPASVVAEERWLVPIVGRLAGANNTRWRSDLRIWNLESAAQAVRVDFRTGGRSFALDLTLQPGETLASNDVITDLFADVSGDVAGNIVVSSTGRIALTSRIYNQSATGSYGMAGPPSMSGRLLEAGEFRDLLQIESDALYRCNLGLSTLDEPASVRVIAYDIDGKELASSSFDVAPRTVAQINSVFGRLGVTEPLPAARLHIQVLSGRVYAYASVIDNRTGDAIFIEGRK